MAVCPDGHPSASDDFCDVCGLRIGRMSAAQPAADAWGSPSKAPGGAPLAARPGAGASPGDGVNCPNCGTGRTGRFCEGCGLDFSSGLLPGGIMPPPQVAPPPVSPPSWAPPRDDGGASYGPSQGYPPYDPPAPSAGSRPVTAGSWAVVISADRDYYEHVRAASGPDAESIVFPAYCAERQFTLAGPEMRIGRYSASRGLVPEIDLTGPPTDPGISRLHAVLIARPGGWAVLDPGSANGTMVNGTEIPVNKEVPLREGDRINLGAWTAITVRQG